MARPARVSPPHGNVVVRPDLPMETQSSDRRIPSQDGPTLTTLPLAGIDLERRTFQISADTDVAGLAESVAQVGLLNPPHLLRAGEGWCVVSGFRRIRACVALGWQAVQVWCLPSQTSLRDCALTAIADNALQRPLGLIERIRASRLFMDHCADVPDLGTLARKVGLAPSLKLLHQLSSLAEAPPALCSAMAAESIQLPMALDLIRRAPSDTEPLAALFQELRPNLNRQREILGYLDDIARRDDLPIHQVLNDAVVATDAANADLERPLRCNRLRAALRHRRYPHLVEAEKARTAKLREIPLDANMQLIPPANFEGRRYQLRLSFSSLSEIKKTSQSFKALTEDSNLRHLLS